MGEVYPVLKPEQEMDVREAAFLPLTGAHVGSGFAEGTILVQEVLQALCLQPKDSGDDIASVGRQIFCVPSLKTSS